MLNLICGSIDLDDGKILIDGHDITREKRIQEIKENWKSISKSGNGNVSKYDNSGKYGHGRQ